MSSRALAPIGVAGNLFAFALDVLRALFRRPFQLREFIQQAWFIASVTIVPTALVAIPFGAVIALQVGGLIKQFGAQSFTGSASVLAVIQQAAPISTAQIKTNHSGPPMLMAAQAPHAAPISIMPSTPRFSTPDFSTTNSPIPASRIGVANPTTVMIAGMP